MERNDLINKFIQIESLAFRARHLVEVGTNEKIVLILNNIRRDLQDLEVEFGGKVNEKDRIDSP